MQIHSNLLHAYVELDAYVNNDQNIIITHKTLVDYIQRLTERDSIDVDYDVVKAEMTHSVVMCRLRYKNKKIVEFGETTKETLGKKFYNYPVITAQEQAFDRAVIKLLELPDNCYSVLELLRNCDGLEKPHSEVDTRKNPDKSDSKKSGQGVHGDPGNKEKQNSSKDTEEGKKGNKQENQGTKNEKPDLKDFVVEYGIYAGSGLTIQEIFLQAEKDAQKKANLDLYLNKDISQVRNRQERICLIALQKYAKQNVSAR